MSLQKWIGLAGVACIALSAAAQSIAPAVTTSGGTANTIPMFTSSSDIENSVITQSSGNVGIGTTMPQSSLDVMENGTGVSIDPSNGKTIFGTLGFNREAHTGGIFATGGSAFQFSNYGDHLQLEVYKGDGSGVTSAAWTVSSVSITIQDGSVQTVAYTGLACGGDYAESIDVTGDRKHYQPGDVLVIDPDAPGKFLKSAEPYSMAVAGIYSTKPGYVGSRQTTPKNPDEVPMAMVGIVPTKVSAENGAIRPGDILVTSSRLGYAMKGTDRSRLVGAVVGKALGKLDSGTGVIEVLVSLQ